MKLWKIQNYSFLESTQNERFGTSKLTLVETLMLLLKNDKMNKNQLLDDIADSTWHLLLIWFADGR